VLKTVKDTISHHLARAAALTPDEKAFTFVDFSTDRDGAFSCLTWRQLEKRVRTLAAALCQGGAVGERVALVGPQNLDYVVGFLAATCAPVPPGSAGPCGEAGRRARRRRPGARPHQPRLA
jgi:acyl-CoA synthetase (AMP-forming)/AMP-acid ligase II